jgi:hypothetical protein
MQPLQLPGCLLLAPPTLESPSTSIEGLNSLQRLYIATLLR